MNDINDWKRYYGEERVKRAELEVATDELVEAAEMVLACIDQPRSRDNSEHAGLDASEALRKATTEVKEFNSATLQYVNGLAAGDLPMVGDLSMLVARLARKLLKAMPADELPAQALDYLSRNKLNGSQECEQAQRLHDYEENQIPLINEKQRYKDRCEEQDALLEQARKALAAMVLEAKARYCGLRIADEALAAIERHNKGEK